MTRPATSLVVGVVVLVVGFAVVPADASDASQGAVTGRVLDPMGQGVSGASVEAWNVGAIHSSQAVAEGVSGPDGRYRLNEVPVGLFSLRVRHPGMYAPRDVVVEVRSGEVTAADIQLARAETIEGRLVDEAGKPVMARVFGEGREFRSGDDGRFVVDGLPPGHEVDLWVHAEGHGSVVGHARAGDRDVIIVLQSVRCREGRVFVEGEPTRGMRAVVTWRPMKGDSPVGTDFVRLDWEGRFELCAAPGVYDVGLRIDGWMDQYLAGVRVPAAGDELVLVFRAGQELAGRVRDPEGSPVEGAEVWLWSDPEGSIDTHPRRDPTRLTTDHEGRFGVKGNTMAPVLVSVRADGFLNERVEVDEPRRDVEITLDRGARISGRVEESDGAPVAGALVVVSESRSPLTFSDFSPQAMSDAEGGFEIARVSEEARYIQAMAPDGRVSREREVLVTGSLSSPLLLTIQPSFTIHGKVIGLGTQQLAEVSIEAWNHQGGQWVVKPDANGAFDIPSVPPGTVGITAAHGDMIVHGATEVGGTAPPPPVELRFGQGPGVSGRVTRKSEPVDGLELEILSESGAAVSTRTDSQGRFSAQGMGAHAVTVHVDFGTHEHEGGRFSHPMGFFFRELPDLESDEPARRELHVELPVEVMQGRVVSRETGKAVVGASIDATSMVGPMAADGPTGMVELGATSDDDGEFRIEGLGDGRTSLMVEAPGYALWLGEEESGAGNMVIQMEVEKPVFVYLIDTRTDGLFPDPWFAVVHDAFPMVSIWAEEMKGRYLLHRIGTAPLDLQVGGDGIAPQILYGVAGPDERRLRVSAGGTLVVRHSEPVSIFLEDPDGRRLPVKLGEHGIAMDCESRESPARMTVRSGPARVVVTGEDGKARHYDVRIVDGEVTELDLE